MNYYLKTNIEGKSIACKHDFYLSSLLNFHECNVQIISYECIKVLSTILLFLLRISMIICTFTIAEMQMFAHDSKLGVECIKESVTIIK